MIKKTVRFLLLIFLAIACLSILCYLLLLAINWRDQVPNAAALEMVRINSLPAIGDDQDNGFHIFYGFDAPLEKDAQQVGKDRAKENPRNDYGAGTIWESQDFKSTWSEASLKLFRDCEEMNDHCYESIIKANKTDNILFENEEVVVQRYQELLDKPFFHETTASAIRFPSYAPLLDAQRLWLFRAFALAEARESKGLADLLDQDFVFWRKVMADSKLLITRMVAVNAIKRNLAAGWIIYVNHQSEMILPSAWQVPFTHAELSSRKVLAGEWQYVAGLINEGYENISSNETRFEKITKTIVSPLFQPQDSMNRHATYLLALAKESERELNEIQLNVSSAQKLADKAFDPNSLGWSNYLYNGMGKILLNLGFSQYTEYIKKAHDLEGIRRLHILAIQLHASRSLNKMQKRISTSMLRNPYDEKPFRWDQMNRKLIFDARGDKEKYYEIPL